MADQHPLPYRGNIRAAIGQGETVAFVTVHPENLATAIYRINLEIDEFSEVALPCGGVAITADAANIIIVGGTDQRIYILNKKVAKPLSDTPLPHAIAAILPLAGDRLAVPGGKTLSILSRGTGEVLQNFELPGTSTCAATDPTGNWLAVGTEQGIVAVFEGQNKPEFEPAESGKLHDGSVNAILFEAEELRFFSAGSDYKILSTHARGTLEPEDKGRGNTHEDIVTALLLVPPGDRLFSGGRDAVVKSWPRAGAVKPVTTKDGIVKVIALTMQTIYDDPHLAVVCDDNSIRMLKLTDDGRVERSEGEFNEEYDDGLRFLGAMAWAENETESENEPKERGKILKTLAEWNDTESLEFIAKRITEEKNGGVKAFAAKTLGNVNNPRVLTLLEPHFSHPDEKVRTTVFEAFQAKLGLADLKPIDLALKTNFPDIGKLAVKALQPLAQTDDQALARLTTALDAKNWEVRKTAMEVLEAVFPPDSPRANLIALNSTHGDLRTAVLVRCFNRGFMANADVQSAIRRRLEDDDASVRKVAFLLALLSRQILANYLRSQDEELHRQLNELQAMETPQPKASSKTALSQSDYDMLLQATSSRALDTCLRGTRALASLGDPRAFGLLLQLSREDDANTRTEVCRALAALGDTRAVNRLRSLLFDSAASVRDAAYSSLAKLYAEQPLQAAEAGLAATEEDVRRRALQTLTESIKKTPPKSASDGAWNLLLRALNDASTAVRTEAFKTVLNQKIAGGGEATLRFLLQSNHASVRRETLTEVIAQQAEPWATPLLYDFFNDAEPSLRNEAFQFATKKNKELAPLEVASQSRYPDARLLALDALAKKHTPEAQSLILKSLGDAIFDVRLRAIELLIDEGTRDLLLEALKAPDADVRVRAAAALARQGDPAALQPLVELAFAPEPREAEKQQLWRDTARIALNALRNLGDASVLPQLLETLDSPHESLRDAAAKALGTTIRPDSMNAIRAVLSHADPAVKYRAALALAYLGDPAAKALLEASDAAKFIGDEDRFRVAVAAGPDSAKGLAVFLDHAHEPLARRAMLVHLFMELAHTDGIPDLCLQMLSSKPARLRLMAAQALEAFKDAVRFRNFVVEQVNHRGGEQVWKIAADVVERISSIITFGDPLLRMRTAELLMLLDPKEQAAWNEAWGVFSTRSAQQITETQKQVAIPLDKLSEQELNDLAFGAYVGLVREQGGSAATPAIVRVRQTALTRLFALAQSSAALKLGAQPVFIQALADPNQPVRLQAFEHLQALNLDKTILGAEALEAGFTDLGVKGLELLTDGTSSKDGDSVLERVLLSRTDELAIEAAKLLAKTRGIVPVASIGLESVSEPMRMQAVRWLSAEYENSPEAQKALRLAVSSRYRAIREATALELATKKDPAAFDVLVQQLKDAQEEQQQDKIVEALITLGDPRAALAFLDRLENDPAGTAAEYPLFNGIIAFRNPMCMDRLLKLTDHEDWSDSAYTTIFSITGFDHTLPDADDELAYAKAEKEAPPLRPELLAQYMEKLLARGENIRLLQPIGASMGSRGNAVDSILETLCAQPDEEVRNTALETLGWRVKHRGAAAEALIRALKHKNPITQFYAAEGLAKAGRKDGITILLSAVQYLEDFRLRTRAVLALGELAEPRAVELLLKLANENGDALQEPAAQAIGHLGKTQHAEKVFGILDRLAKLDGTGVADEALRGLRWFNSPAGWDIIRLKAKHQNWLTRQLACELLKENDDPATRDLLVSILQKERDSDVYGKAFISAIKLFPEGSLAPHYAVLVNDSYGANQTIGEAQIDPLKEVCQHGDALRILQIFPRCDATKQAALQTSLLTRAELPVPEAGAALTNEDDSSVRLAARILGKSQVKTPAIQTAISTALKTWWNTWQARRMKLERGLSDGDQLEKARMVLQNLMWCSAQCAVPLEPIAAIAQARSDDVLARSLRLDAVRLLASVPLDAARTKLFASLATSTDAEVRLLAIGVLAQADPARVQALAPQLMQDAPSSSRAIAAGVDLSDNALSAMSQAHSQPIALRSILIAKDVAALAEIARNMKATESVRLGAVEGLGFMANEQAEAVLVSLGQAEGDDEDIRKASWKALKRSRRQRRGKNRTTAKA